MIINPDGASEDHGEISGQPFLFGRRFVYRAISNGKTFFFQHRRESTQIFKGDMLHNQTPFHMIRLLRRAPLSPRPHRLLFRFY